MPFCNRVALHLTRIALFLSLLLTLALAALYFRTYYHPAVFTRKTWDLSPTHDCWSELNLTIFSGHVVADSIDQVQPAFTGQFITAVPFTTNRTDPVGITWQRTEPKPSDISLNPASSGDSPRPFTSIGLIWQSPTEVPTALGSITFRKWWVQINLLFPLMLFTAATIFVFLLLRRASLPFRRQKSGLCPTCGYDLHATPTRCPECGTAIDAAGAHTIETTDGRG